MTKEPKETILKIGCSLYKPKNIINELNNEVNINIKQKYHINLYKYFRIKKIIPPSILSNSQVEV